MNYSDTGQAKRKIPIARSTFMRAEEIDRERAMSGWNPYQGEEEPEGGEGRLQMPREAENMQNEMQMPQRPESMQNEMQMPQRPEDEPMRPYFQRPEFSEILEEQRDEERDLRRLQSMFPETAKLLMPYIGEECDRMEYEGSAMFDEYPDPTTVRRIQQRVKDQVESQFPAEEEPKPDEMLSMQYQGRSGSRPGHNWLEDMIQVMLLEEMHHRRRRHRRFMRDRF